MPDLPAKKVGIVTCSGEELPEGTVTRLAALQVLEHLRPADTVTICLPLFLAGGEGDRAFAKFYPTIAVDGCERRCAARGTELYSSRPAASLVVTDLITARGLQSPRGLRRLDEAGQQAVEVTARHMAGLVDDLLKKHWDRTTGAVEPDTALPVVQPPVQATCSCGSGIPVQQVMIHGQPVTLVALPLIFQQAQEAGKSCGPETTRELLETVRVYNPIPPGEDSAYAEALAREYEVFLGRKG